MTPILEPSNLRLSRRSALRAGLAALAGLLAANRRQSSLAAADDYCYWKRVQGPVCDQHQLMEYLCEECCGGGTCETVSCAWRVTGTC